MRAKDHQLYLESEALTFHFNFYCPAPFDPVAVVWRLSFASARAPIATVATGALHCGLPFILLVALWRIVAELRRSGARRTCCVVYCGIDRGAHFEGTQRAGWLRLQAGNTRPRLFDMELLSLSVSFEDKRPHSGIDHVRSSLTHDSQESKSNLG